jgi:hypothetical protein
VTPPLDAATVDPVIDASPATAKAKSSKRTPKAPSKTPNHEPSTQPTGRGSDGFFDPDAVLEK